MHHEDGIEVYLKPLGENFATTKLREIPIEQDQSEPRHKRCVVYKTAASFAVVLRFSDDFNMGAASALSAGIGMGGDDSKLRVRYWNIPRSMRDLGRSTFTKNSKDCPTYSFTTSLRMKLPKESRSMFAQLTFSLSELRNECVSVRPPPNSGRIHGVSSQGQHGMAHSSKEVR